MKTKRFPIGVILTFVQPRLFCEFKEFHKAVEFLLGVPVWTHEFGSYEFSGKLKDIVLKQHPQLLGINTKEITSENWQKHLTTLIDKFGDTLELTQVEYKREKDPLQTLEELAPGKPVIVVEGE